MDAKTHPRNDRACSNRATPIDCPTRQDRDIRANNAVIFDHDWLSLLRATAINALLWIDGRRHGDNTHIRSDDAAVPDLDQRAIKNPAVAGNTHVLPDRDVIPIVACERQGDDGVFTHVALEDIAE